MSETHTTYLAHGTPDDLRRQRETEVDPFHTRPEDAVTPEEALRLERLVWSEAEFTRQVIAKAHEHHWKVHHCRPARTSRGWRTPIEGDRGFLDIVLARQGYLIFTELKSETGELTVDEELWMETLLNVALFCHRVSVVVWRPSDWDQIVDVLADPNPADYRRARGVAPHEPDAPRAEEAIRTERGEN